MDEEDAAPAVMGQTYFLHPGAPSLGVGYKDPPVFGPIPTDHLVGDGFTPDEERRIHALMSDSDFREAQTRRDQIAIACKHLRAFVGNQRFTFQAIGRFLGGLNAAVVEGQLKMSRPQPNESGRPRLLSPEVEEWMLELIVTRFNNRNPVTYAELLDLLQYNHNVAISGTPSATLSRTWIR
jgi:hypothetical protein